MGRRNLCLVVLLAFVTIVSITTIAQNQQSQQAQTQPQQNQTQPPQAQPNQAQPTQTQPATKQSFWQKMKASAMQGAQNSVQQGSQQVQQGAQQGVQGVQQGATQSMQGVQQGVQQSIPGVAQGNSGMTGMGSSGSCGQSCFNAGPFQANVSQMTMSQQGPWHIIRMNIQFHNSSNQPLVIAYHDGSMVMVDNNGNTYQGAGGSPGELQGMGIDRGNQTDSQFTLGPGQTGNAMFSVARARAANSPVGTSYSYNLTIDELQLQNGATAIPVRTYDMNFASLSPGSSNSMAFGSGSPVNSFTGGSAATGYAGTTNVVPAAAATTTNAVPATATAAGTVQTTGTAQQGATAATVQRRMINGRPVAVITPATGVNNAAVKTNAATPAKPAAVIVKPIPTATTTNTTNTKKTATTPTTATTNNK